jgi:homoserine kinase
MHGLLGIALSGAGPSIVALVDDNEQDIAARVASCFQARAIDSTVRVLDVDNEGCRII